MQVVHESNVLYNLYLTLSGQNFAPIGVAVWFRAPGLFGLGGALFSLGVVALDRFLSLFIPS